MEKIYTVGLRAATLLSKFALIFLLAGFMGPSQVGLYGLVAVTVSYALFFIGFEFYTYSMREFIAAPIQGRVLVLRNQASFYLLSYVLTLPILLVIFFEGFLPWNFLGWFYLLLVLEHLAQEVNRLLVAASMNIEAGVVLFIRSGLWCLVVIVLMWMYPSLRNLEMVFVSWSIGSVLAIFFAIQWFRRSNKIPGWGAVNWSWIILGVRTALPMLVAALAIRGLFTFDRYWIEYLGGLDVLGAYVLYAGIASAVVAFLDSGVVVFFYPRLVCAARKSDFESFNVSMTKLFWNVLVATVSLVVLAYLFGLFIVGWLDVAAYSDNFYLLKWCLAAVFVFGLSHIPHMGLYARGQDRSIVLSQVGGVVLFFVVVLVFGDEYGVTLVPLALLVSFSFIFLWKTVAYFQMKAVSSKAT